MPTIIDELVVLLKLDPKQFDEAQKAHVGKIRQFERDHERHSKKLSKDTDGLTQSFVALQGRLLGIASLFMGGMADICRTVRSVRRNNRRTSGKFVDLAREFPRCRRRDE